MFGDAAYARMCLLLGNFEDVSIPGVPLLAGRLCCLTFQEQ